MMTPETVADEAGEIEAEQKAPGEASDIQGVRAYVLQMLSQGRGAEAIEMLVDLLSRLREAHTSTVQRLQLALRQLYGRRSEKLSANTLQMLLSFLKDEAATPAAAEGVSATAAAQTAPSPVSEDNTAASAAPAVHRRAGPRPCLSTWSGAKSWCLWRPSCARAPAADRSARPWGRKSASGWSWSRRASSSS
jgi:transposase